MAECRNTVPTGLTPMDFTPWNAYPWSINRAPTESEIVEASTAIVGLLELLPNLEVVLQDREAQAAWRIALESQPAIRRRRLISLETYHPSVQALRASDPAERRLRAQHRVNAWNEAADLVKGRASRASRQVAIGSAEPWSVSEIPRRVSVLTFFNLCSFLSVRSRRKGTG